jgi:hypothetical protein
LVPAIWTPSINILANTVKVELTKQVQHQCAQEVEEAQDADIKKVLFQKLAKKLASFCLINTYDG